MAGEKEPCIINWKNTDGEANTMNHLYFSSVRWIKCQCKTPITLPARNSYNTKLRVKTRIIQNRWVLLNISPIVVVVGVVAAIAVVEFTLSFVSSSHTVSCSAGVLLLTWFGELSPIKPFRGSIHTIFFLLSSHFFCFINVGLYGCMCVCVCGYVCMWPFSNSVTKSNATHYN